VSEEKKDELNPITREHLLNMLAKLPNTSKEELAGAGFPDEIVEEWGRMWSRPPIGKVHAATGREYRSNCAMKFFPSAVALNQWFDENFGYILFEWKPADAEGSIYALIGQVLAPEESILMEERASVIEEETQRRVAARQEAIERHVEELKERAAENRRLIEKGRKCEQHHGAAIEERRKEKKK
jgi:hypothetical protein